MDESKRRLDGIVGPVFDKASDVNWQEVRSDWEELTGKKLQYSFWRGFFLWLFLVGIFIYLQVAFFDLYFSKPYLATKINNVVTLAKSTKSGGADSGSFDQLESNLSDLRWSLAKKGQFFVFLSYDPIFKSQTVDLSRLLLANQSALALKSIASSTMKTNSQTTFKLDFWLASLNLTQIEQNISLVETKEFASYKQLALPLLNQASSQLSYLKNNSAALATILGVGSSRHYLLLFPNNKEARNWGGFSGTYGILTLASGQKPQIFMRDIYALDRIIRGNDVNSIAKPASANQVPPALYPDQKIFPDNPYAWWYLCNAATSLDFATNSQRAIFDYETVDGQSPVDGLIALTPDLVIDVLKIIGPIPMPAYGTTITADNFRDVIEDKVEIDNAFKKNIDKTKDPKQILVDLAPIFEQKVSSASLGQKLAIGQAVLTNLQQKQIAVYFKNPQAQTLAENYQITGELKTTPNDYLAVYDSNYNGRKTSLTLNHDINLQANIAANGLATDDLTIKVANQSTGKEDFGGTMQEIMEIAVPQGAQLISATSNGTDFKSTVKTTQEKDKTIFFFPYITNSGDKIAFEVKYTLQNLAGADWGLELQKQPGMEQFNFDYTVKSPKLITPEQGLLNQEQIIKQDQEFKLDLQ